MPRKTINGGSLISTPTQDTTKCNPKKKRLNHSTSATTKRTKHDIANSPILNPITKKAIALPIFLVITSEIIQSQLNFDVLASHITQTTAILAGYRATYIFAALIGMAITNSIFNYINSIINLPAEQKTA